MTSHDATTNPSKHTNALVHETSPYLLQHAHNPVDWLPWGEAAFAQAKQRDVPIFLSIGYSTCYWCHVMEREVFENETIAKQMNELFVCVKVDREQRPDIDEIYMTATQIMTRRGGWPMSVFMTPPDGRGAGDPGLRPFWCGTYIPPTPMHGMTSFPQVLDALSNAWHNQRSDILEEGDKVAAVVAESLTSDHEPGPIAADLIDRTANTLCKIYDETHGGFGDAPKFPTPCLPGLLLAVQQKSGDTKIKHILRHTLDRMVRGGIFDQVGGGFHRYSVDERWLVPHFEKMLYDNGQLAELYAGYLESTDSDDELVPVFKRGLAAIGDYVIREMTDPSGAFWSAQDAEVDGQEGLNYLWMQDEMRDACGDEKLAALTEQLYGMDCGTNFQDPHHPANAPTNVLFVPEPWSMMAKQLAMPIDDLFAMQDEVNQKLLAVRDQRKQPTTDDKVLTAWNGMMIAGLAKAGQVLGEPRFIEAASRAADAILSSLAIPDDQGGGLYRTMRQGKPSVPGFLEDYAHFVHGLIELHRACQATASNPDNTYLQEAERLTQNAAKQFAHDTGGYYDTLADQADLFVRTRSTNDGATNSGNSQMIHNLVDLSELTGNQRYAGQAGRDLQSFAKPLSEYATNMAHMVHALLRLQEHAPDLITWQHTDSTPTTDANTDLTYAIDPQPAKVIDGIAHFNLHLLIRDGLHLSVGGTQQPGATQVSLAPDSDAELLVDWPQGEPFHSPLADASLSVYAGRVALPIQVHLQDASPSEIELQLDYQPCSDTACQPPQSRRIIVKLNTS
ncbi:MAG: DUF255 domain-containing protein [Phycisphaeraceae bacterium]